VIKATFENKECLLHSVVAVGVSGSPQAVLLFKNEDGTHSIELVHVSEVRLTLEQPAKKATAKKAE